MLRPQQGGEMDENKARSPITLRELWVTACTAEAQWLDLVRRCIKGRRMVREPGAQPSWLDLLARREAQLVAARAAFQQRRSDYLHGATVARLTDAGEDEELTAAYRRWRKEEANAA